MEFKTFDFLSDTTIITGSTTGTKFGATGNKIGFLGATPIVRQSAISAPSTPSAGYSQAEAQSAVTAINSIRTTLQNFGLIS